MRVDVNAIPTTDGNDFVINSPVEVCRPFDYYLLLILRSAVFFNHGLYSEFSQRLDVIGTRVLNRNTFNRHDYS